MDHRVRSQPASQMGDRSLASRAFAIAPLLFTLAASLTLAWGCAPRVVVEAPKEPIEINLNIKIKHEIRVMVDDDLEQLFEQDDELF